MQAPRRHTQRHTETLVAYAVRIRSAQYWVSWSHTHLGMVPRHMHIRIQAAHSIQQPHAYVTYICISVAIRAFNAEVATAADKAKDPRMAEVRLQWWKEVCTYGACMHICMYMHVVCVSERVPVSE
jgi:hypothetical protein